LALLAELRREGLSLTPDGDQHLRIAPPERLTPALRQRIVAAKPELIAALRLHGELAKRIRAMAARWGYSPDDLQWALDDAGRRPDAWLACCAEDEAHHELVEQAGIVPISRRLA
jgi:hypothetical protein